MPCGTRERINMTSINGRIVRATAQVLGEDGWEDVRPVEVSEDGSVVHYCEDITLIGPPIKPVECQTSFTAELVLKEQGNG